ncbi:hypothetical protein Dimus_002050 [Dionaea muscipula]
MKKQETSRSSSSSSRRDRVPTQDDQKHHANAVGCMAGIFHLVSKYQNRRKFLTFGRKQEKQPAVSPTKKVKLTVKTPAPAAATAALPASQDRNATANSTNRREDKNGEPRDSRRLSSEVQRSPPIPAEIRRSSPFPTEERQSRPPTALMARLMGLDEVPALPTAKLLESKAAEKRRKLLGALEKCDEDLKALRKIIEAVRSGDCTLTTPSPPRTPPRGVSDCRCPESESKKCVGSGEKKLRCDDSESRMRSCPSSEVEVGGFEKKCTAENGGEQPSPMSVLDAFAPSPPSSGGDSPKNRNGKFIHDQLLMLIQRKKKLQGGDKIASLHFLKNVNRSSVLAPADTPAAYRYHSKIESVEEVCRETAWGHGREVMKIGLIIQDQIYKDLIEEIIEELLLAGSRYLYLSPSSLPFVLCKRKLLF